MHAAFHTLGDLTRSDSQSEPASEHDARPGALVKARRLIFGNAIGREVSGPAVIPKKVMYSLSHAIDGAAAVGSVISDDHIGQILQLGSFHLIADNLARAGLAN